MKLSFYTLYFLILIFKVKIPAVQPKRLKRCFCDDCKTVDPPCLSHREKTRESHPVVSELKSFHFSAQKMPFFGPASQPLAISSTLSILRTHRLKIFFVTRKYVAIEPRKYVEQLTHLSALNAELWISCYSLQLGCVFQLLLAPLSQCVFTHPLPQKVQDVQQVEKTLEPRQRREKQLGLANLESHMVYSDSVCCMLNSSYKNIFTQK